MKNRRATAAMLARGRKISAELYETAISIVRRVGETVGEDPEPTIRAITTRYRALLAVADESARLELTAIHRTAEELQEIARMVG